MKAPDFEYVRVQSLAAALGQLGAGDDVSLLAGGQSLIASLNLRLSSPRRLIDISRIPEMAGIRLGSSSMSIGALTKHCEIESAPLVRQHLPLLAMAAPHIAHPAIRNRGTIGGSLALADPAAEWPACCLALDAVIEVASLRGVRRLAARDFFLGLYTTALESDEIITSVEFPVPSKGSRSGFSELARRHGDYAMVGLAAQGQWIAGRCMALKLVFFSVSDRPVLAHKAASLLISGEGLKAAQDALQQDIDFSGDDVCSSATRLHLAKVLLERVMIEMENHEVLLQGEGQAA